MFIKEKLKITITVSYHIKEIANDIAVSPQGVGQLLYDSRTIRTRLYRALKFCSGVKVWGITGR